MSDFILNIQYCCGCGRYRAEYNKVTAFLVYIVNAVTLLHFGIIELSDVLHILVQKFNSLVVFLYEYHLPIFCHIIYIKSGIQSHRQKNRFQKNLCISYI